MDSSFKDKKILITGVTGFVGSHLAKYLADCEGEVIGLGKIKSAEFNEFQKEKLEKIQYIQGDITNLDFIKNLFKLNNFNYCFHLAGQALLESATDEPVETFEVNIGGTWNILEASRKSHLDGIVLASTTHVYGNNKVPYLEEYYPRPTGPYETSKSCADIIAQMYATYYNMPIAIARFVNIYGPGDSNNRLIPKTIKALFSGERPKLYTNNAVRDYLFIDDAIEAYVTLIKKIPELKQNESNIIFNFGTGKHYSCDFVVSKIMELSNILNIKPIELNYSRPQEIEKQYISLHKVKTVLNWEAKNTLENGLKNTIAWYKAHF